MTQHYRIWLKIALGLLTLSLLSCGPTKPDIEVDDIVIGGYEGAAGGPNACTEVHTVFTDIPPAHFSLRDCLQRLSGKAYLDGIALSKMQDNIDLMCTSLGSCTYAQRKVLASIKAALSRASYVHPKREEE